MLALRTGVGAYGICVRTAADLRVVSTVRALGALPSHFLSGCATFLVKRRARARFGLAPAS